MSATITTEKAPLPSGEGLGRGYGEGSEQRKKPASKPNSSPFLTSPYPHPPFGHLLPEGEGLYDDLIPHAEVMAQARTLIETLKARHARA